MSIDSTEKSTFKTEVIAGVTTFLSMSYIIFVNPEILSAAGMDKNAVAAVTCLASAIACFLVGIICRSPLAMAPGMGLNAFFAYSLVLGQQIAWETALGIVFLSGFIFFILTVVGLREKIVEAIPKSLVYAIGVGIGLFITFIGLVNLGLVVKDEATLISLGRFTPEVLIGLAGLVVMLALESRGVRGALLIGIIVSTAIAVLAGRVDLPGSFVSAQFNIMPVAFKLDILGAVKWSFFGAIFTLMFMDMFDSIGTLVGVMHKIEKDVKPRSVSRLLAIDAAATMIGAVIGTSTTTVYLESSAGVEAGGRRGTTAAVVGILFLAGMLFVPIIGIVPAYATAPALIMVGLFMARGIVNVDFSTIEDGFPAFIIIIMIALAYSISGGLALGFISYTLLKVINGKYRQIKPAMWVIAALSVVYFLI
jgi:adenine/guanine/hypoxanthine permease